MQSRAYKFLRTQKLQYIFTRRYWRALRELSVWSRDYVRLSVCILHVLSIQFSVRKFAVRAHAQPLMPCIHLVNIKLQLCVRACVHLSETEGQRKSVNPESKASASLDRATRRLREGCYQRRSQQYNLWVRALGCWACTGPERDGA